MAFIRIDITLQRSNTFSLFPRSFHFLYSFANENILILIPNARGAIRQGQSSHSSIPFWIRNRLARSPDPQIPRSPMPSFQQPSHRKITENGSRLLQCHHSITNYCGLVPPDTLVSKRLFYRKRRGCKCAPTSTPPPTPHTQSRGCMQTRLSPLYSKTKRPEKRMILWKFSWETASPPP